MIEKRLRRRSVKEAFDNLPSGICYFDKNDILRLSNRQMYRIVFVLADCELQDRKNFDLILKEPPTKSGVMREKNNYLFPDGKVWKITKKSVIDENEDEYTEYLAFDVTELYRRKQELEISNAEQQEIMNRMENIARNIVAITREEEILSMKMKIHNQLGFTLQSTRKFIAQGCPADKKEQLVAQQRKMAKTLLGETGNTDEVDAYAEIKHIADHLGIRIVTTGELPQNEQQRNLVTMAVCECLTNTVRHAGGDEVYVKIDKGSENLAVTVTNNGTPPKSEITPGGGLISLRDKIERFGGTMQLVSLPEFKLTVTLPDKEGAK